MRSGRGVAALQRPCGGDLDLVRQIGAQTAERERLRVRQALDQRAKTGNAGNLDPLGRAAVTSTMAVLSFDER